MKKAATHAVIELYWLVGPLVSNQSNRISTEEVMQCYYHPSIEAVATCTNCGKAICQTCSVDVAGRITCQKCLSLGSQTRFQAQSTKPTNTLAIVSLVLGILGLCGGLPFAIVAWITGHMARKQLLENPNQEGLQLANVGRGLGIAITVLNCVTVACVIVIFLLYMLGYLLEPPSY